MKGFTLTETLVSIFIFVLIITAVFGSIVYLYRDHSYTWQQSLAVDEVRRGIKIMTREIREAREGDDGSYPIEKADDKEFIFYSDIDEDGQVERVRYFLGGTITGSQTKECVIFNDGGSCSVSFSDFFTGTFQTAQIKISAEGDLGWNNREYGEVFVDGSDFGDICRINCVDCLGSWEGDSTYNVSTEANDNSLEILIDATSRVNGICHWIEANHAMKVKVELTWTEDNPSLAHQFKKGVINPVDGVYDEDTEEVSIISSYVRNSPPIFQYFDSDGSLITQSPIRLLGTKLMRLHLIVNVDPNNDPGNVELESYVRLRNIQ